MSDKYKFASEDVMTNELSEAELDSVSGGGVGDFGKDLYKLGHDVKGDAEPKPNVQVTNQQIKCVSPMTFSQKLYQSHPIEIAEEFEQAIEANSLEKIEDLLNKVLEIGSDR